MDREIPGYECIYKISNTGKITRIWKTKETVMKTQVHSQGYVAVSLTKDGKNKTHKVHRLLALTWLSNPQDKAYINHIDGNKQNNSLDNIEWCTPSENSKHAHSTGLNSTKRMVEVAARKSRKMTSEKIKECQTLYDSGLSLTKIQNLVGISRSVIATYLKNKRSSTEHLKGKKNE